MPDFSGSGGSYQLRVDQKLNCILGSPQMHPMAYIAVILELKPCVSILMAIENQSM